MIFTNGLVFSRGRLEPLTVTTRGDVIAAVGKKAAPHGGRTVDLDGRLLLPGLVDIHTHGCGGVDYSTASPEEIARAGTVYAQMGTTSRLAAVMTLPGPDYLTAIERLAASDDQGLLGLYLEGPFFSPEKCGAQNPDWLRAPDPEGLRLLPQAAVERVRVVCVDPDLPGALPFIRAASRDRVVALAHTACGYETGRKALACGASIVTHCFNAMAPLHHREPGLMGAALDGGPFLELICDGVHIHPAVVRLLFRAAGERVILISDSTSACGMPDGAYVLGGRRVNVAGGVARMPDGTLAGSASNLLHCLRQAIAYGVPPRLAMAAATENPARAVGLLDRVGVVAPGRRADFVVLNPDYSLHQVYQAGRPVACAKR